MSNELEKQKNSAPRNKLSNFLKFLLEATESNYGKSIHGRRFVNLKWKTFAAYTFQIVGPKSYSLLQVNCPGGLPCITTLKQTVSNSTDTLKEGEIRFDLVAQYLEKRGYPKTILIGEDGTRVISKVQYDPATNQLVGLVSRLDERGLPQLEGFPATSASVIKKHLDENALSNYAYCLMAQPLADGAAPICLALFGTNNKFPSLDVSRRWKYVDEEAAKHGITVIANASDGDTRLMKCMQKETFSTSCGKFGNWFKSNSSSPKVCIQDYIHIATKLRNRLLKPSILLPLGSFLASPADLRVLIKSTSKDQHNLCLSDISPQDKMNYRSVEKMMDKNVCHLLKTEVPESLGTTTYLKMIRQVVASFKDKMLSPIQRITFIWRWVFFLRLWRDWLIQNNYSTQENFITSNAYFCIEINAHSLIILIIRLRDSAQDDLFLPWLFSSQCCESFFRHARLLTSTLTTVVNFTILELLHRIRRIDFQADVEATLGDTFIFPSSHRSSKSKREVPPKFPLPSDEEIIAAVAQAEALALKRAQKLNMETRIVPVPSFSFASFPVEEDLDNDGSLVDIDAEEDNDEDERDDAQEEATGISEDLCMVSTGTIGVKTWENVSLAPNSIYVKVADGFKHPVIIKKITLLYIWSQVGTKLSSDRLLRVTEPEIHSTSHAASLNVQSATKAECINEDDWCAFATSDKKTFLVGRTIAFGYQSGDTNKELQFSRKFALVNTPTPKTGKAVGVLCVWYSLKGTSLVPDSTFSHGYHNITFYVCTIPRPSIVNSSLSLDRKTCGEIRSLFRSFKSRK